MDEPAGTGVTLLPTGAGMKTCRTCAVQKAVSEFYRNKKAKDGLQSSCKPCMAAAAKAWKQRNPDRANEYSRIWRAKNPDKMLAANRAWREANPEKMAAAKRAWNEANAEHARELVRSWKEANPGKAKSYNHRRRARKACAVPQRWQIHDVLPFACYWCGSNLRAYGATAHVDHVMPISLGGPAVPSNEVMTCATCNRRKNAKHPLVWIAELTA